MGMDSESKIIPHPKGMPITGNDQVYVYKKTGGHGLELHFLKAADGGRLPTAVFFFGGGWIDGQVTQFMRQAMHLNRRGMHSVLVDYRVQARQNTSPVEAIQDARSAMRFLKTHADDLGVNPHKMAAIGGSAGGHLAFCTYMAREINDPNDDLSVDPCPQAIVGFNPVLDTSADGFGHDRFPGDSARLACPVDMVTGSLPPNLILQGTADETTPVGIARKFKQRAHDEGVVCHLIEYQDRGHGFFNEGQDFFATLTEMDLFLVSCEFIPPKTVG